MGRAPSQSDPMASPFPLRNQCQNAALFEILSTNNLGEGKYKYPFFR